MADNKTGWLQQRLEHIWYQDGFGATLLSSLEWLYRLVAAINRRSKLSKQINHPVPIIVVGNISVGGTGKTPLVVYLAQQLQQAGYRPGIITRGYGGKATQWPVLVKPDSSAAALGDEPVLMAQRSNVPVVAGPDRNADIEMLLKHDINIVISDDGLQHYQLKRDIEIAVIDGARGLGNGRCLPAGPLREPASRLKSCDFVIVNEVIQNAHYSMQLKADYVQRLNTEEQQALVTWKGQTVHAVTGIGNPSRFFNILNSMGLRVIEHAFPDHHSFSLNDVEYNDTIPVLMTEKDAVKCKAFALNHHWFVPVNAVITDNFLEDLITQIKKIELKGNE